MVGEVLDSRFSWSREKKQILRVSPVRPSSESGRPTRRVSHWHCQLDFDTGVPESTSAAGPGAGGPGNPSPGLSGSAGGPGPKSACSMSLVTRLLPATAGGSLTRDRDTVTGTLTWVLRGLAKLSESRTVRADAQARPARAVTGRATVSGCLPPSPTAVTDVGSASLRLRPPN